MSMPPLDAQLAVKVLEDAMEKFELLEAMTALQDHSSTDELSQRIGVLCSWHRTAPCRIQNRAHEQSPSFGNMNLTTNNFMASMAMQRLRRSGS